MPLSFKNWGLAVRLACNHLCSLTRPRKLTKLPPQTGEQLNPQGRRHIRCLPPWRGERPLYAEFSHLIVLYIRCCVRATNNSVSTVSTTIAFNALRALIFISTVLTNKIPCTIYNSIALILYIDHLNMPFNVNKVTMITVSGFLTI